MFAELSPENMEMLAGIVTPAQFAKGSVIIGQDEVGTRMYLLTSGRVRVSLASHEGRSWCSTTSKRPRTLARCRWWTRRRGAPMWRP